ncbi:hypothetical protein F5I97DRAFT_1805231 [Phlebopus sp. FC_14]|nr:hypothetical protein F5I97DRAFT_1805231 [Phlebopus sp. FC_14]
MDREVQQLVEMGATVPQARAALRRYKDVMEAAERIFDGEFAEVEYDGGDVRMTQTIDYVDYESDYETARHTGEVDPYAGIFFSKDRREEVIEVEEEAETALVPDPKEPVKLLTQGEWMKGCPEGNEQSFLFALYDYLSTDSCACPQACGYQIDRKKSDFFPLLPEFSTYIEHLRRIVTTSCPSCNIEFCYACGEPTNSGNHRPTASVGDVSLFHCSNLQGVILGVGLAMLEMIFAEQRQPPADEQRQGLQRSKSSKKRKMDMHPHLSTPNGDDDEDDGYYISLPVGKKAKGGTGYAGDQREDTSGQIEAQAQQRAKDEKIGSLLSQIRVYLPSLRREGGALTSDYMVHPTALAHLRRRFNYLCSTLLRNDSLTDMSDRSILYFELFEWLETISNHEALASMMAMPIMVATSIKSVATKKLAKGKSLMRERTIIYEGSAGPRELLEAVVIQAQAAIKGLDGRKTAEREDEEMTEEQKRKTTKGKGKEKEPSPALSDENQKLLAFCQRILATANAIDRSLRETKGVAFVDRLHASLPKINNTSTFDHTTIRTGETEEELRKTYVEWATAARFEYCDLSMPDGDISDGDTIPHYKSHFNSEARMLANSEIPKRSLAIAKELAVLTTNLPVAWDSSIFMRVDENRVDIIKALIIGPEGTPYQDGCYLFDIFLGPSYNQSPPSVKYMTTNGGKYRFNPNLYADGKVCLSLLGTWTGPGWISGRSTLLQVLVSIQSMILCDEPYLNEPGWANGGGTPQSKAYSANVRRMVVRTAMLGNLKKTPEPFGDVIRTHYRLKAQAIITQLDKWLTLDDGKTIVGDAYPGAMRSEVGTSSSAFKKDVEEMQGLLRQLQDGTFQV